MNNRNNSIDNLKGIAFILMIIHHIFYFHDLTNNTNMSKHQIIENIGKIARIMFIILSGYLISITLNEKNYIIKRIKRSLLILCHGLILSYITYIYYPKSFIRFGILHFLALSTILLMLISPYKKLTIIIFLISILFKMPKINPFIDTITGAKNHYNAIDQFSLQPWISILILGLIIGQASSGSLGWSNGPNKNILNNIDLYDLKLLKKENLITLIGKNSLNLYTIHIIILILYNSLKFNKL